MRGKPQSLSLDKYKSASGRRPLADASVIPPTRQAAGICKVLLQDVENTN